MSETSGHAAALLARVDAVEERLSRDADSRPAPGLTQPDPPTGERWDHGQVWAHLGEFVPYWIEQARLVADASNPEPVSFGRVKSDPVRVAAIERDRTLPPGQVMARLSGQLADLRAFLAGLSAEGWERRGLHPTLGEMEMPRIVEEFMVGHLESHADQLDGLRAPQPEG
jgi:DinB superfamily